MAHYEFVPSLELVLLLLEGLEYILPLILGLIFFIFNFIKSVFKHRVPLIIAAVYGFFTFNMVMQTLVYIIGIIESGFYLSIPLYIMIAINIICSILVGILNKKKISILGLPIGLLIGLFYLILMFFTGTFEYNDGYLMVFLGAGIAFYSIFAFVQEKKIDRKEAALREQEQQEQQQSQPVEQEMATLEVENEPIEHPKGYVQEPKENEVIFDDDSEFKQF